MAARFNNLAFVEHNNQISVFYRRNPVTDENHCLSVHYIFKIIQNAFFCFSVNSGKAIIKNQDLWLACQGPCNAYALFLPTGKIDSTFSKQRFKSIRKFFNIVPRSCSTPLSLWFLCDLFQCTSCICATVKNRTLAQAYWNIWSGIWEHLSEKKMCVNGTLFLAKHTV